MLYQLPVQMAWANQFSWFALFYKADFGLMINLILFVLFMFSCYLAAKWFSVTNGLSGSRKSGRIVERIYISPQATLLVIELQGTYYIMAQDKNGIHMIDKREDWVVSAPGNDAGLPNFQAVLNKYIHIKKDR